jgi:hypothetical protein
MPRVGSYKQPLAIWSVLLALLALAACAPSFPHNQDLDTELASRSRTDGLAIATTGPRSGKLPVYYFDQKWEHIDCCEKLDPWVVQGGRSLIAVDGSFPFSLSEFRQSESLPNAILSRLTPNVSLLDVNGVEQRRYGFRIVRAGFIAVSADARMIAFWGQAGPAPSSGRLDQEKGLLFGPLGSGTFQKIEALPEDNLDPNKSQRPETLAWSPDASEITYGKDGTIFVYELRSAISRPVAKGSNPLWSPDGVWISYRGTNGEALIVNPSNQKSQQLMPGRKINHALHWSPDGRYLLLTLLSSEGSLKWASLAIYRLRDGALTSIGEPGLSSLDDSGQDWIVRGPHN